MKRILIILAQLLTLALWISTQTEIATSQNAPILLPGSGPTTLYPILFVTQVPIADDFTTVNAVFGNHQAAIQAAGRGGDLWIRYPDSTLKNLTAAAGYGTDGLQGTTAIAVRDPAIYWDGTKAIFSMAIGAPVDQYQVQSYYWQLYEITGLGKIDTPQITRVQYQPEHYNNVSPIYGSDDRIIFTSDRPRTGERHLYPQRDEYEGSPTNSGLWSLDPVNADLRLLNHAPSGDFSPSLDSFGRVIFTQWDHLQRDQLADGDALTLPGQPAPYGAFNYADESATAAQLSDRSEVFPEPRSERPDLLQGTNLAGHSFNHFLPWQINEDGTALESLNHLGRHEFHAYLPASLTDDPNVIEYYGQFSRFNPNPLRNMLQIRESPTTPGLYFGTDAPEFETHAAGQIVSLAAAPTVNASQTQVGYVTARETANTSDLPSAAHSGLYRDPLPLADGMLVAAHTPETRADANEGSREFPRSRYDFRLKQLIPAATGFWVADGALTPGFTKSVSWWDPDVLVSYTGPLWELQPVEVRARARPPRLSATLPAPEQQMFTQAEVDPVQFQAYLSRENLALIVTRNVTRRDALDKQQPYNLRVSNGGAQTIGAPGRIYDVAYLQLFQADQLRGFTFGGETPRPGRRVLAQAMHDPAAVANNVPVANGPVGSVSIAADGSVAAFVPARRAVSWQITDSSGVGVVRERNWLSFQPGEIRVCTSCHAVNQTDQANQPAATNPPQALLELLQHWKAQQGPEPTPTLAPTTMPPDPSARELYLPLVQTNSTE